MLIPSHPVVSLSAWAIFFATEYAFPNKSSGISKTFATCAFGITRACPLVAGPMSKITLTSSSSYKVVDGISPAAILQKIQLSIINFLLFSFFRSV